VINGDAPLSHDLLEVSIGHGVTDVKKHSVQNHGLGVVHAFEINHHSAQLAYLLLSKCSATSDGRLEAQKFATDPRDHRRPTWAAVMRHVPSHVSVQPDQQWPALAKRSKYLDHCVVR